MDIAFYALVALASILLLLVMWVCAASGVQKWGPDLTAELPPHLVREIFFHNSQKAKNKCDERPEVVVPSAPSDLPGDPLLTSAQPMGRNDLPPPFKDVSMFSSSTPVRVLPREFIPRQKLRPTIYTFTKEEPA